MKKKIFLILFILCTYTICCADTTSQGDTVNTETQITTAVIHTSAGDITLELYNEKAPITVENFITYTKEGFYNGLIFHRIINNFMIQGGGFDKQGTHRVATHDPIQNEATNGLSNKIGTIAMARTNQINSATSQFFINVADNNFLDHKDMRQGFGYAVFGAVTSGMDVVNKIKTSSTCINKALGMRDWPTEPVTITSIEIL